MTDMTHAQFEFECLGQTRATPQGGLMHAIASEGQVELVPEKLLRADGSKLVPAAGLTGAALLVACSADDQGEASPWRAAEAKGVHDRKDVLRHILAAEPSSSPALPSPSADELMDWAELTYSVFFPTRQQTLELPPYRYRYYPESRNYLGVSNGSVYVLGPLSGGEVWRVGALADFARQLLGEPRAVSAADAAAARALLQTQFSALPAEIAAVQRLGFDAWLTQQMDAPLGKTAVDWLFANGYDNASVRRGYVSNPMPTTYAVWEQMWLAPDTVRTRAALALSEFFVVSGDLFNSTWKPFGLGYFWDCLTRNAFGSFRQLLEEVSTSHAMGQMLNIIDSHKEDGSGRQPDENFARELMQLFTIGLYELNLDGSMKLDVRGRPIETYNNEDVRGLARVFTGYTFAFVPGPLLSTDDPVQPNILAPPYMLRPMDEVPPFHEFGESKFLKTTVPAGTEISKARSIALDALFKHPNVGPFFAKQMIQRLVISNPSAAYVERVARAFNDNGKGVRGDLKAVFRAIWIDGEARSEGTTAASRIGKLSEPMLRMAQFGRSFVATDTLKKWRSMPHTYPCWQMPLMSGSVFNYYRPDFSPPATEVSRKAWVAPEFQIVNETSVAMYLNFLNGVVFEGFEAMASDDIFGPMGEAIEVKFYRSPVEFTNELAIQRNPAVLLQHLNRILCAGSLPQEQQRIILDALLTIPIVSDDDASSLAKDIRRFRVASAVLMVMSCPEYLVQQ